MAGRMGIPRPGRGVLVPEVGGVDWWEADAAAGSTYAGGGGGGAS